MTEKDVRALRALLQDVCDRYCNPPAFPGCQGRRICGTALWSLYGGKREYRVMKHILDIVREQT